MDQLNIRRIVETQRGYFNSGRTKDIPFRKKRLSELLCLIKSNDGKIVRALQEDMKKPALEAYASEIAVVKNEIKYALNNVGSWSKTRRIHSPKHLFPGKSYIMPEPWGVSLIIAPWNYPFNLAFAPLVSAIAGGNCAVIKPSEFAPYTSSVMAEMIYGSFDPSFITVVTGDSHVAGELLNEKFDYIFFTGGTNIGRLVMEAAARNLTPVTLELGGKSPCIVDKDINIDHAAKRIAWAKFFNAGQTCVAPDYVLADKRIKGMLVDSLKKHIAAFYGENPISSGDYARIINIAHFTRLKGLMGQGDIVAGGHTVENERYIAPTIIDNVGPEYKIMETEIFGPILPVLDYENLSEAISFVNSRPKPLSLYFFSSDTLNQERILNETSSGGVCINDAMVHVASHLLPFGGAGNSGMGAYHGKAGFDTFTHYKGIVKNTLNFDLPLRYAPYRFKLPLVRWFF
jgi:aldehyde dehydrogenase (NAD+)